LNLDGFTKRLTSEGDKLSGPAAFADMDSGRPDRFRFGTFELDARTGELRRRGLKVRLRGRPIEILLVLLERQGELVTRDELRGRLWSADTFVDFDHGLNSAMNKLREGLGETADNPRFIETVPRRGYRFIAPVETTAAAPRQSPSPLSASAPVVAHSEWAPPSTAETSAAPPAPSDAATPTAVAPPAAATAAIPAAPTPAAASPAAVATATTGAALVEPVTAPTVPRGAALPSGSLQSAPDATRRRLIVAVISLSVLGLLVALTVIAYYRSTSQRSAPPARVMLVVLPFDNLSGGAEQDFFSDGITDEMIAQLGALDPRRLGVIARTTALHYKRSGKNVMDIGRELHVDYLLEGSVRRDATHVRITAQLIDVKSQTQLWSETYERDLKDVLMLQRDVAMRIAQSLAGGVLSPVLRQAPAAPAFAAYELVLRARAQRQLATEDGGWRCVAAFEEAIRIDPAYAPAHAGLSDCYRLLGAPGWEAGPPRDLLERARTAAERALALDPNLADAYAARGMVRFNLDWDLDAADRDLQRAIALNPSSSRAHQYRSAVLMTMSKFGEAVDAARRARDLDPMSATESTTLGVRLYYAGRHAEAIEQFQRTLQAHPNFSVAVWGLAQVYREQGRMDLALTEMRRAVELANGSTYMRAWLAHALASAGHRDEADLIRRDIERGAADRYVPPFLMALMAAGSHDAARTIEWLEKTYDARSGWMPFVPVEPELRWLRSDARFQQLVARITPR
jgi:TolB-like protein/DNA-binding winged helix-turn-helix (wHTH) protein/tetratricopeptide (TPR) repeat protein